jgi:hypothetical protein
MYEGNLLRGSAYLRFQVRDSYAFTAAGPREYLIRRGRISGLFAFKCRTGHRNKITMEYRLGGPYGEFSEPWNHTSTSVDNTYLVLNRQK